MVSAVLWRHAAHGVGDHRAGEFQPVIGARGEGAF
jgi:hypothetical protein